MNFRIGQGYDIHIFGEGDFVTLGLVEIKHHQGVVAHSDGDVIVHALCDAIYGALALGDIGTFFPPSQPQWRDASSRIFLEHAKSCLDAEGYMVANLDVTVIAEAPKIGPHREAMVKAIGETLSIRADQVSIKATTNEKMGAIGRQEGLAAFVTVLIFKE